MGRRETGVGDARCFIVPAQVVKVVEVLKDLGHTAYIAGGAVRDMVMGRPSPEDWDVATSAQPEEVMGAFNRVIPTGAAHGTVTVREDGMSIEVTTYRIDGPYQDGRHPEYVRFVRGIEEDLARRDFTINAMALDPATGELVDPFGGRDDAAQGLIRCVGDSADRFAEDKLRMVRAARFAAKLGFGADPDLVAAARELAPEIQQVSVERVTDELTKMMKALTPSLGLALLEEMGLAPFVLPELCASVPRQRRASLYTLCDELAAEPWERFALLFAPMGPAGARRALTRMRASRRAGAGVAAIIRGAQALVAAFDSADCLGSSVAGSFDGGRADTGRTDPGCATVTAYSLRLVASQVGADNLAPAVRVACAVRGCSGKDREALVELAQAALAARPALRIRDLDIDGHDVMRFTGIRPGPAVRRVLSELLGEVLRDPAANAKPRLLELAREVVEAEAGAEAEAEAKSEHLSPRG